MSERHECFSYCCLCRYSISGSGGYSGRGFENKITNETHYYCYTCYPKAIDIYVADLKRLDAEKAHLPSPPEDA